MEAVQVATSPFQCAMSTKSGCENIAHTLQGLTEMDPRATGMSIDGISAYDLISRQAMMQGLRDVPGGNSALPFVLMFCGTESRYLWEDSDGGFHSIVQAEGGEQGDAMMPLLFCFGQHRALVHVQSHLREGEVLMAFLDDTESAQSTGCWRERCGVRQESGSTKARHRSGIWRARCLTNPPDCGGVVRSDSCCVERV